MKSLLAIIALAITAALTGCATPFPYGASYDRHAYASDQYLPKTVYVKDSVTDQLLMKCEVPVGQELIIDFDHKTDTSSSLTVSSPAEKVRWTVVETGTRFSFMNNEQELSGNPPIIYVELRPAPEPYDPDAEAVMYISDTLPVMSSGQPMAQRVNLGIAQPQGVELAETPAEPVTPAVPVAPEMEEPMPEETVEAMPEEAAVESAIEPDEPAEQPTAETMTEEMEEVEPAE